MWCCQGLSAGLVFLGVWIFTTYSKFEHLSDVLNSSLLPAYVLLAVGVVLFALGTVGCIGAVCEHKCLIGLVNLCSCFITKMLNLFRLLLLLVNKVTVFAFNAHSGELLLTMLICHQ